MVLQNSGLREYLQPVLTCPGTESLLSAINLCYQTNSEWIVVVDQQQQPQGCIALSRLSCYLLEHISVLVRAETDPALGQASHIPLQMVLPDLATGLITIPADLTLLDILPFLQHPIPFTVLALINAEGEFLGLLDDRRILQALSNHHSQPDVRSSTQPGRAVEPQQSALASHQRQTTQLMQQVLAQKSEFELRLRSQQQIIEYLLKQSVTTSFWPGEGEAESGEAPLMLVTETQGTVPLLPMQALLEYLPLPLMLQTNDGQIFVQNAIWRQEFEALLDPIGIRRAAACVLEEATDLVEHAGSEQVPAQPSVCEVGSQPDRCICACPLKDGGERIVQFVKVRLGHLVASTSLQPSSVSGSQESDTGATPSGSDAHVSVGFRLANLAAQISDDWVPVATELEPNHGLHSNRLNLSEPGIPERIPGNAQPQLWLVLAQDITEQHRLAQDLTAKNADLVQLNRLKDEFLACISHELRTPLTAVLGLSTLLSDQTLGPLNPRQARYAKLIHQSGRHLMAVVNDIMDLTRIETGQLVLTCDLVTLKTVCEQAFEQARQKRQLEEKAVDQGTTQDTSFTLEIESGLTTIVADELRLRQMLENLLSNAFKFTEVTHSIGLRVSRWGGWIAFTVWDTGIGIPNDQQHLIFQKFQQLESPLTRRFEGTGLGLVLTQRLARLHGGDISFLSQEGKGSQFTILLPPQPPAEVLLPRSDRPLSPDQVEPDQEVTETQPQSPITNATRNRLVLIVEAVPHFIDRLSAQLMNLGYRVVVARTGTEALEKARRLQPCLIFLNPLLPMLSGWDVLTLLKTSAATQSIPVVVTATPVDEEQANRCNADGFLQIPIQLDLLRQLLGQLLAQQAQATVSISDLPRPLTLLKLRLAETHREFESIDFNELLQSYHYRLLEADDLEQGELLARVWNPDLIMLDGSPTDWLTFLQQFRHHTMLASRPLVTLDALAQPAAQQVPGLTVFTRPVLPEVRDTPDLNDVKTAWLQLIQLAIGYIWQPVILTIDNALWSNCNTDARPHLELSLRTERLCETEWAHALIQYLLTAGLRGHLSQSRQEAIDLLQSGTVDLLLISWTDDPLETEISEILEVLNQLNPRPPLLLLDHRTYEATSSNPRPLPKQICKLADRLLPSTLPMAELLNTIQALLSQSGTLPQKQGAVITDLGKINPNPRQEKE